MSYSSNSHGCNSDSVTPTENREWSYATEELLEALPRPWTRGLLYFLVIFVVIALPWAMLYKVEETGTARGRLEPEEGTVEVEAPIPGQVSAVRVSEGDTVEIGDVLLELDSETVRFELASTQAKLEGLRERISQLEIVEQQLAIALRTQRLQAQAQVSEQEAQVDQIRQRISSWEDQLAFEQERLKKNEETVQLYQDLLAEGVISKTNLDEVESRRDDRKKMILQLQADIRESRVELQKQQKAYHRIVSTGELTVLEGERQRQEMQTQIAQLRSEIAQTSSEIESLKYQLGQRIITAKNEGVIFQLPVSKPGAVVQADQLVAEIAPKNDALILKAKMATTESGSLEAGMPVKLKFDAYPFQDYGIVNGVLLKKSPTSKVEDTADGEVSIFEVEVGLEQDCLQPTTSCIPFQPGDTATAEVIVRQRRIIDFVLDPFKKLQEGGIQL